MWLSKSSVGRKVVMSVTGLFLILFVTFHVLMNAVAIISPSGYNAVCHFLGANWYALAGTLVLAAGFVIHIILSIIITLQNKKARGNDAYDVNKRPKNVEWASQNMLALGIIVVCFIVVHLIQFWYRMQWQELNGTEFGEINPANGVAFLDLAFSQWYTLVIYLIGFAALWFHMTHGFWSAFQSLGTNNNTWMPRLRCTATIWATIVCILFAVEGVVFTLRANCPECKAAQECVNANCGDAEPCTTVENCNAECK
ncbi:MAG: succinate dehydrogenase/fumarate reductase cytochrome b subunit [Muribaculaceae bacterium]|nr:succinate dehydrogenase/fumarate reductase cytochrome b subunit [Muribaculaceae bacterium]